MYIEGELGLRLRTLETGLLRETELHPDVDPRACSMGRWDSEMKCVVGFGKELNG